VLKRKEGQKGTKTDRRRRRRRRRRRSRQRMNLENVCTKILAHHSLYEVCKA
jgi:hypothetical protein